jgi:diguanylate cyclase (GGDEF)-like protein/PAS domain S-box-containing protein
MSAGWAAFAAVLAANAMVVAFLAVRVWRQSHVPGRRPFGLAMLSLAIWAGGYAGETLAGTVEAKADWLRVENVGIVTLVPFFFLFALRYTGGSVSATRRAAAAVFAVPAVTLGILYSGRLEHWHYAGLSPFSATGGPLVVTAGPWYRVLTVHSQVLMLAGTALLLRAVARRPERYRVPAAILLAGMAAPWAVHLYYLAGALWPGSAVPIDLTPLAFGVLGLVYGVGVFRLRLFELVPVARDVVLEGLPEVVIVLDAGARIVDVNQAAASLLGAPRGDIVGRRADDALGPWPALGVCILATEEGRQTVSLPGEPLRWLEVTVSPLRDRLGRRAGRVVVARDVTGRQRAGEQIRLLSAAIESAASAVVISDPEGVCLWVNPAFTRITGYAPEDIVGRPLSLLKSGAHEAAFYASLWRTILSGEVWRGEIVNRHKDGRLYTEEQTISPVRDETGRITHFVAVKQDVTERRRMEEGLRAANETLKTQLEEIEALQARLRDQAIRDPLTGVLNRRYLTETLTRETARARRDGRAYAVVLLDLDHFKRVNDTYGHEAGDRVLVALADLLRAHTREGDVVCRYGGEEFVVLMPGSSAVAAARRAQVWRTTLEAQPFGFKADQVTVTLSAGVACFPDDGGDGEAILRAADQALYQAKGGGRNRVMVFTGETAGG